MLPWENNLLAWLDNYCMIECVPSNRAKVNLSPETFFRKHQRRLDTYQKRTNFSIELLDVFPEEYLTFTEDQKESMLSYLQVVHKHRLKPYYCWFLAKILSDFEKSEDTENGIYKAVLSNYEFLKEQYFKENGQAQIDFFNIKEEKPKRPNCVNCGSSRVVSSGINWLCNSCGRAFRKVKRRG